MKFLFPFLFLAAACAAPPLVPARATVSYHVRFEPPAANERALREAAEGFRTRLGEDGAGARFTLHPEDGSLEAELPFAVAFESGPEYALAATLAENARQIHDPSDVTLPHTGVLHVDGEWLGFARGAEPGLLTLERGLFASRAEVHMAGAKVRLYRDESTRLLLGVRGEFAFLEGASAESLAARGADLEAEHTRLRGWLAAHPGARASDLNGRVPEEGGPPPGTRWCSSRTWPTTEPRLVLLPAQARERFERADVESFGYGQDPYGDPGLSFELRAARVPEFSAWTKALVGRQLAIVLDDEVLALATVRDALPGSCVISLGGTPPASSELHALVRLLQAVPLALQPRSLQATLHP